MRRASKYRILSVCKAVAFRPGSDHAQLMSHKCGPWEGRLTKERHGILREENRNAPRFSRNGVKSLDTTDTTCLGAMRVCERSHLDCSWGSAGHAVDQRIGDIKLFKSTQWGRMAAHCQGPLCYSAFF